MALEQVYRRNLVFGETLGHIQTVVYGRQLFGYFLIEAVVGDDLHLFPGRGGLSFRGGLSCHCCGFSKDN